MGKIQLFEINFEPNVGVFFAGGPVKGFVKLELRDTLKMRGIRMTCLGRAHVRWSEVENVGHRGGRQRVETVEYTAEEEYFQFRFQLWPLGPSNEEPNNLPAGQHTFPFQFQLARELPPSFEGAYGYIRYWTKVTIDEPWKFDHHTKRAFTVIPRLDLNQEPNARDPIRYHGELRTGCCCLPSGRFSGSFSTNRRGFVPGAELGVKSEIGNQTGSTCWAEVKLKLLVTYLAQGKFKQEKKIVSTLNKEQIPRGKKFVWRDCMHIPSLPPSLIKGCKLIKTQYILHYRLGSDASCSCDDIEFEDQIIIGTLPLKAKPSTPGQGSRPPDGIETSKVVVPLSNMPSTMMEETVDGRSEAKEDPSSYEECLLFGKVSIKDKDDTEHTLGELVFTPLYALYTTRSPLPRQLSSAGQ